MAKNNKKSEWDFGWDENWDTDEIEEQEKSKVDQSSPEEVQQSTEEPKKIAEEVQPSLENILSEEVTAKPTEVYSDEKTTLTKTENALEEALSFQQTTSEFQPGQSTGLQLEWGIIDDTKPVDLKSRLKNLINPFSTIMDRRESAESSSTLTPTSLYSDESLKEDEKHKEQKSIDGDENEQTEKLQRPGFIPRFKSSITKDIATPEPTLQVDDLALGFNNLNSVSAREMDDVFGLLEGSLGKSDAVEFDEEILNDENINFVAHEKKLSFAKPEVIEEEVIEEEVIEEDSADETMLSDTPPDVTLIPDINQIKFDLKSAQENNILFEEEEIDEVIQRIPFVRQQLIDDGIIVVEDDAFTEKEIGQTLFQGEDTGEEYEEEEEYDEALDTTDDLLDSLLDEIDGDLGESSFADSDFDDLGSFGQDEILSESDIMNDDDESALEFMDSAAMEVDNLFEDFFTQDTDDGKEVKEAKPSIVDKWKERVKQLKSLQVLLLRFIKDPKYFFEYYSITIKDVYVFFGFIFCTIIYTGMINYQALTDNFPMNLF
ncbi:MAG: hypothetical protein COA79_14920 [Planctomycetota bacterium]|nr:MAG: hypothetical protein COA79_14920 [Planctomycetota bacterium]